MTCIKGMLMMATFVLNGVANDFFIGCSFYATTIIGLIYFTVNPYQDPAIHSKAKNKYEDYQEKKIREIEFRASSDVYSKVMGNGYKMVSVSTVFFFLLMVMTAIFTPFVPVEIL